MKNWFSITARAGSCELSIYDEIGMFGVNAKDFANEFASVPPGPVTLRINSPGGSVFDAVAIFNILDRHNGDVNVVIDGIAASAASYIAMVGKTVTMPDNAFLMVHNPSGLVMGEASDMRESADVLDKIATSLIRGYARKSGKSDEDIAAVMDAETWFTASEALDFGLVDSVTEPVQIAARFDMSGFKNAPNNFSKFSDQLASSSGLNQSTGGIMSDTPEAVLSAQDSAEAIATARAAGVNEERARMSAILAHPKAAANPAVAQTAITNGLSIEQAGAMLSAMPEAAVVETTEPEASADGVVDIEAKLAEVATKAANAAIAAMMDTSAGTGVGHGGAEGEGSGEKFVAAMVQ